MPQFHCDIDSHQSKTYNQCQYIRIIAITIMSWSVLRVIVLVELCTFIDDRTLSLYQPDTGMFYTTCICTYTCIIMLKTDGSYIFMHQYSDKKLTHPNQIATVLISENKSQSAKIFTYLNFLPFPIQNQKTLHFIRRLSKN